MIHQLNKNNQIEVNGISAVLLDERAKERIFVDTEDLGEPKWQRMNKQDIWVDLVTTPSKESSEPYFKSMPVRQVVRFKQPDRMEVVWEYCNPINDVWTQIHRGDIELWKKAYDTRQIFILKEKETVPCPNCTHFADWCSRCQGSHKVPLTKEYSMNEVEMGETPDCQWCNGSGVQGTIHDEGFSCPHCTPSPKSEDLPSVKPIPDVEGKSLQECKRYENRHNNNRKRNIL